MSLVEPFVENLQEEVSVNWEQTVEEYRSAAAMKKTGEYPIPRLAAAVRYMEQNLKLNDTQIAHHFGRHQPWITALRKFYKLSLSAQAFFAEAIPPSQRLRMDDIKFIVTAPREKHAARAANLANGRRRAAEKGRRSTWVK